MVHFRREKYVPRGGPDGGDGGKGGDVVLLLSPKLSTLSSFRRNRHFRAESGRRGGPNNRNGRSADDLIIPVPPGTIVRDDDSGDLVGELIDKVDRLVVARGGRGGRGNSRFANSRNQAPRMAEKGEPGADSWLNLELRLLADVGIIGVPNAGKTTFLAAVTKARPKIADYPFTTLQPNLGVVDLDDDSTLILADIPGLIEGAHSGTGLGTDFLRHLSRTRALIHLIDGSAPDPLADYSQINAELALFDIDLADKPQVVAVNKLDIPEVAEGWNELLAAFNQVQVSPLPVSALARDGLREVLNKARELAQLFQVPEVEQVPVYRAEPDGWAFDIRRDIDGAWLIESEGLERAAAMTYWEYEEAVRRFQRLLVRIGVNEMLREGGIKAGDTVRIGDHELEWEE